MESKPARIEVVRDTYFGVTIEDPYRWMEDWNSAEARAWLDQQATAARELLDALPERAALRARIGELSDASPRLYGFQLAGGRTFYFRREPGEDLAKLIVRDNADAVERVLVDPNTIEGEAHTAIDWFVPSRDGQRVAYGLSQGGSEDSTLYVLELGTGEAHGEAISRTRFGAVAWLADQRSFVYHRLREYTADTPEVERYAFSRSYLHRLGSDPELDPPVFGHGLHAGVEIAPDDFPLVVVNPQSPWMLGVIFHGVLNELTIYAAPLESLAEPRSIPWRRIVDVEDGVRSFDQHGDLLFMLSSRDAPRFQVLTKSLRSPEEVAQVLVPAGEAVIQELRVAGTNLLLRDLDAGIARLRRVALEGGPAEHIPLPFDGTIPEWANQPGGTEVIVPMTSWTVSPRVFRYDVERNTLVDTGWLPPSPVDFSAVESYQVRAPSADGTLVPLSIVHRKDLRRDGKRPTLLIGYGSYGIPITPFFEPALLAWYERGGVVAVAHIRGGGEFGDDWHRAGQKLNKQRTVDDFIAGAEYLIEHGYTDQQHLAGEGTSAGGIPSGNALVQRPDLWAVMVIRVGVTNALRFELSENGPPNVPEFGSVSTEDGFRALQLMDAYTKVVDGVAYPAVLLTTGLNDPRVVVWQATKMAARLQAATSSGRPVLLRVEYQGGHGMGATKTQVDDELADQLAFLLAQFG